MNSKNFQINITRSENKYVFSGHNNAGAFMCCGRAELAYSNLNGALVKSLAIKGIETEPEYRRNGLARSILELMDQELIQKENILVSYLHPFSFSYYRMFGYERISDHKILEFPISALDFLPRYNELFHCTDASYMDDLDAVYNRFAQDRNIMFKRNRDFHYPFQEEMVYMSKDSNGDPDGYITLESEMYYNINRMSSINLHIHEIAYTTAAALRKLLGFVRMFEGELDTVKLHDCAMAPEIENTLRHYSHIKISVIPDLMARIHNVGGVLSVMKYPETSGTFTVKVYEPEKSTFIKGLTEGVWKVAYSNGKAGVVRLHDDADYDISLSMPELTQIIFGYNTYGSMTAQYMPGVTIKNDCADFSALSGAAYRSFSTLLS